MECLDDEEPPFYNDEREYIMKQTERDKLWGKMAEGIRNIYNLVEKQEKHLEKLNDSVAQNAISCAENKTSNKNLWRVIYFIIVLVATALGLGIGLK